MYDYTDFPVDAVGYQPQPFIETVLLIAVVVLPFLAGFWGYWLRGRRDEGDRGKILEGIYDAIDARARSASAAVGPAVLYGADLLVKEIKDRLGDVIKLGGPLSDQLDKLEKAIKGPPPPPPPPPEPKCTCVCTCAAGKGDAKGKPCDDGCAAGQVNIMTSGSVIVAAPPAPPTPVAPNNDTKLDPQQRVRLAVGVFTDYWSGHKAQRLKELKAAQKALLTPAPAVPKTPAKH